MIQCLKTFYVIYVKKANLSHRIGLYGGAHLAENIFLIGSVNFHLVIKG